MPTINYIDSDGNAHAVEVQNGFTLMEGAFNEQIPGMRAECGGAAACGTCHAYVSIQGVTTLPPIEDLEDSMLYLVTDRRSNSRLTCQIYVTDQLEGIEVTIAQNE